MDCFARNLIKSISKSIENQFLIDSTFVFERFLVSKTIPKKHIQITKTIIQ